MAVGVAVPFGEPAVQALEALIAAAKGGDPLAPVTVVTPSNYAGLSLRRRLGAKGGLTNVRFLVLARVAEFIGAPMLSERAPVTRWRRAAAVARALARHQGMFSAVAGHAATERALLRLFRELDTLPPGALETLARQSARAAAIRAIYHDYRADLADTYDLEDLAAEAASGIGVRPTPLRDLGHVVLYLPRSLTPAQREFVRALLNADLASAVFGLAGDAAADQETRDLAESLGMPIGPADEMSTTTATAILRAADLEEEVRSAVRRVVALASEGTALDRVALLFANAETYAPLVAEVLAAAELPFHGPPAGTLVEQPAARSLLTLLRLEENGFRREEVIDWLATAPVRVDEDGAETVPAASWDELGRDAGVVRGLEQWQHRLLALLNHRDVAEEVSAEVRRARDFMVELGRRLSPPAGDSLAAHAAWALDLVTRYLGEPGDLSTSEDEFTAHERVRDILRGLSASDGAVPGGREGFVRLLQHAFADTGPRLGPFGRGVFVGQLSQARGMEFEHVFVLGMVDGVLPGTEREDPLLNAEERDAVGMAAHRQRRERQRADYLAALATAPARTLCFPRSSLRDGASFLPSPWLLESVSALAGETVTSDDFLSLPANEWLSGASSFQQALRKRQPLSLQEWELASLDAASSQRKHFLLQEPRFRASLMAASEHLPQFARRYPIDARELSPWAGNVGAEAHVLEGTPFSPTSFETLASCPYRYFLTNVIRVKETAKPSAIVKIGGADRGTLIHEVLERFFVEVDASGHYPGPNERWSDAHRERLLEIAAEACHAAYDRGVTGSALLWRNEQARIRRDLMLFLDADQQMRAQRGTTFVRSELGFGMARDPGDESEQPPVEIDLDGARVQFRGRIDRVDRATDGAYIVYDYKSGSARDYEPLEKRKQEMGAGRYLQLPIYALAARELAEEGAPIEAYYWFTSETERFRLIGGRVEERNLESMNTTLTVLSELVNGGLFPAVPGAETWNFNGKSDGFAHCNQFCRYGDICEAGDRAARWEVRKGAAGLEQFVMLSEIQEMGGGEDE